MTFHSPFGGSIILRLKAVFQPMWRNASKSLWWLLFQVVCVKFHFATWGIVLDGTKHVLSSENKSWWHETRIHPTTTSACQRCGNHWLLDLPEGSENLAVLRQKLKSTIERQIQDKHPNHAIYRSRMHSLASSVCPFARLQTSRWARTLPGCTFPGRRFSGKSQASEQAARARSQEKQLVWHSRRGEVARNPSCIHVHHSSGHWEIGNKTVYSSWNGGTLRS